jgi:hypothetical protein
MTSVAIDPWIRDPLHPEYHCRNGQLVDAEYQSQLATLANQIARLRPKQIASFDNDIATENGRTWWRFSCHLSPLTAALVFRVVMMKSQGTFTPPRCGIELYDTSNNFLIPTTYLYGGGTNSLDTISDVPDEWTTQTLFVDVTAFRNTTVRGSIFTQFTGGGVTTGEYSGRILSATVYEQPLPPDTAYGYLAQRYSLGQNIATADRQGLVQSAIDLWKRGMAPLANFSSQSDDTSPANSTTTWKNIIDNSTTPGPDSPGFWLDLRACNTKSRANVPCRFEAAFWCFGGTGGVRLVDQSGAVLSTLSGTGGIFNYFQDTPSLPPTLAKYDVQFQGDGTHTCNVYAVNLYQHLA